MSTTPPLALRLRRAPALRSLSARGDDAAFAALYQRHHQELYRYCRAILRNDDDARDALQSAMAKAFAALRGETRDFELRPWLFRIAHNEAISLLRRRTDATHLDAAPEVAVDSLPGAVADRQRLADLRADLGDLPERQRSALVLRELSGLGHEEIAEVLSSSPRAVKQLIFEARTGLHECAEGRDMACDEVQRALSDADGRVLRGRRIRAHLRSCRACRQFRVALGSRPADLRALAAPLPAGAGAGLLAALLPSGSATVAGGAFAGLATKVAVVATVGAVAVGATAVERSALRPAPSRPAPAVRAAAPTAATTAPVRLGAVAAARRSGVAAATVVAAAPAARRTPQHASTARPVHPPARATVRPAAAHRHAIPARRLTRATRATPATPARRATPARPVPAGGARPARAASPPRRPATAAARAPAPRRPASPLARPPRRPAPAAARPRPPAASPSATPAPAAAPAATAGAATQGGPPPGAGRPK